MKIHFSPRPGAYGIIDPALLGNPRDIENMIFRAYPGSKIYAIEHDDGKITLTCMCCGFSKNFENSLEAFHQGWDGPNHFTGFAACDLCPATFIVMDTTHKHDADHERWKTDGRPTSFCLPRDVNSKTTE